MITTTFYIRFSSSFWYKRELNNFVHHVNRADKEAFIDICKAYAFIFRLLERRFLVDYQLDVYRLDIFILASDENGLSSPEILEVWLFWLFDK